MTAIGKIQQTAFAEKIAALQKQLGIPENYGAVHQLELCEECAELVSIGKDIFDRDQKMTPQAAQAWFEMKDAAAAGGIELQAISAFRSVEYQAGIISRKLDAGQSMAQILKVSAAPGYSEHHSVRAPWTFPHPGLNRWKKHLRTARHSNGCKNQQAVMVSHCHSQGTTNTAWLMSPGTGAGLPLTCPAPDQV